MRFSLPCALGAALALVVSAPAAWSQAAEQAAPRLEATDEQGLTTDLITRFITDYHYLKTPLDDALSADILERYFESLDPNRSFFLQTDIERFAAHKQRIDDYLRDGRLKPAFEIFNVFRKRTHTRVAYAQELLEREFDFKVDETYVFDRGAQAWAEDRAALDDIWRKRVKNDVLTLRLAGKDEVEIEQTLHERYERLATGVDQLHTGDVYQLFINAYAGSVEPHTSYLLPRNSEDFEIRMSLSLEGIGAVLQAKKDYTVVRRLVAGGPAELSGRLEAEDRIVGVGQGPDGEIVDVIGWRLDEVVDLIRGPKGSTVRLRLLPHGRGPQGRKEVVSLTRNEIKLEEQAAQKSILEVSTSLGSSRIGVIEVPAFYVDYEARKRGDRDYRSTTGDVRRLLGELQQDKVDGVIIDLRDNGGGSLSEATQLTGLFIESGPIVQIRDARYHIEVLDDPDDAIHYAGPLAVLVNGSSASASEIFAGAIQDYHRGLVIGEPTFGKGTVQKLIDLNRFIQRTEPELGHLKATIAQFYRVSGGSTQYRGVIPDVVFPTAMEADDEGERSLDNALPWNRVPAVEFDGRQRRGEAIKQTRQLHRRRIDDDPAFAYLMDEARAREAAESDDRVSLLEARRREQRDSTEQASQERLKRLRDTHGEVTPNPGVDNDEHAREQAPFDAEGVLLTEAARVLDDYLHLSGDLASGLHTAGQNTE